MSEVKVEIELILFVGDSADSRFDFDSVNYGAWNEIFRLTVDESPKTFI